LAATLLVVCYLGIGLSAALRKSQTGDEGAHLAGGMTYWGYNDYRVQPENGNWPQRLCGLPVWLLGWQLPTTDDATWREMSQWDFADKLIYESGNDADRMLLEGRVMTALLGATLGLLVGAWSTRLFGALGGLVSLTLYAFSPTMLTHGFLITSDMASALFFLASVGSLWMLLHRLSVGTVVASWLALSGLFLSKFSAPLVVPMAAVMVAVRLTSSAPLLLVTGKVRFVRGRLWQLLLFAGLAIALAAGVVASIWASYGFRYSMCNPRWGEPSKPLAWTDVVSQSGEINAAVRLAREYRVLPEAYLYGFSHVMHHSEARNAFLNGEFRRYGWPQFFPFCLLVKTPLELFALLGLALAALATYRRGSAAPVAEPNSGHGLLYRLTPLAALFVVYWLFALTSHLNIGHRHLLPTYPPLLIVAGASAWWLRPPRIALTGSATSATASARRAGPVVNMMRGLVVLSLLFMVAETIWFWPHYLAYFNRLVGGPRNGYRHLVDSSLDWSQDLKEVKTWLDAHPDDTRDPQRLYFSFYGSPPPEYYGIEIQRLPSFPGRWTPHAPRPLTGGTYLISATLLDAVMLTDAGRWNEEYESRLRNLQQSVNAYYAMSSTPEGREQLFSHAPENEWQEMFKVYETLRFSRLTSFLRLRREPDDEIGYSILVYRLTDAEVALAVEGPAIELLEAPEWQLEDRRRMRSPE